MQLRAATPPRRELGVEENPSTAEQPSPVPNPVAIASAMRLAAATSAMSAATTDTSREVSGRRTLTLRAAARTR
jgi:hypothetical protein